MNLIKKERDVKISVNDEIKEIKDELEA